MLYDALEEKQLIEKTKQGDSDSLSKLVAMHTGILYQLARRNSFSDKPLCNFEEQFSNRFSATYEAVQTYPNNASHKFITHLANVFTWDCIENLEDFTHKDEYSYDPQDMVALEGNFYEDIQDNIDEYLNLIENPEIIKVMTLRFKECLTWKDIAKIMEVSHTCCQLYVASGLNILRGKLKHKLART